MYKISLFRLKVFFFLLKISLVISSLGLLSVENDGFIYKYITTYNKYLWYSHHFVT